MKEIVYRDLALLKPNEKNPRKGTEKAIRELADSIKNNPDFFEARPILLSNRTGELVIIGGERRSEAAKLLGMDEVPTILIEELTEQQEDEIMIKDNTHSGEWVEAMLHKWDKEQLKGWGVEVPDWGNNATGKKAETKEDDYNPDEAKEARCKPGDIWQLGKHRLMCGDSTKEKDVDILMDGDKADIAFSSPPYNTRMGANLTGAKGKRTKYENGLCDNLSQEKYYDFLNNYINNANKYSVYNFVNIQMITNNKIALLNCIYNNKERLADVIIWDKGQSQPQMQPNVLNSEFEFVLCFSEKGNRMIGTIPFHGSLKNIVHIARGQNKYASIHNAVFPVELPAHFISNFAKEKVLDLFGGTGTTLIAAEQLGRKAYVMEIYPNYCDVIIDRWEKLTGEKAFKIN